MGSVIKARSVRYSSLYATVESVRAEGSSASDVSASDAMPDTRDIELLALQQQVADLRAAYAQLELDAVATRTNAREEGYAEGLAAGKVQASLRRAEHEAALRDGLNTAMAKFDATLRALEPLSIEIALTALERIFGDAEGLTRLVERTARHHVSQLSAKSIVMLEVSAEDFASDAEVADAMSPTLRGDSVRLRVNPQLKAGQCLVRLSLGTLDISLDSQLGRIRDALQEAAT
ncbi:hypothetical protein YK56LOC_19590 [Caballeronia sp. HLA56]